MSLGHCNLKGRASEYDVVNRDWTGGNTGREEGSTDQVIRVSSLSTVNSSTTGISYVISIMILYNVS